MFYTRRPRNKDTQPVTHQELFRTSLVISCDFVAHVNKILDALDHPELPLDQYDKLMRGLKETALSVMGSLAEIEEITRPTLPFNEDVAWLTSLFKLPDTRKESPLEQ